MKKSTINYFQIIPASENEYTPREVSEDLKSILVVEPYAAQYLKDNYLKISEKVVKRDTYFLGSIFTIQMTDIPSYMAPDTGVMNALPLSEMYGLANNVACFLIDPVANILAFEQGCGVTPNQLLNYLTFNNKSRKLNIAIILASDNIHKFNTLTGIKSFEFRIANRRALNSSFDKDGMDATIDVLNDAEQANADKITVKYETIVQGKSLNLGRMRRMVADLINSKDTLESIKVSGENDYDEKIGIFELVDGKLEDKFSYENKQRLRVDYKIKERLDYIEEKYLQHRKTLIHLYNLNN